VCLCPEDPVGVPADAVGTVPAFEAGASLDLELRAQRKRECGSREAGGAVEQAVAASLQLDPAVPASPTSSCTEVSPSAKPSRSR